MFGSAKYDGNPTEKIDPGTMGLEDWLNYKHVKITKNAEEPNNVVIIAAAAGIAIALAAGIGGYFLYRRKKIGNS